MLQLLLKKITEQRRLWLYHRREPLKYWLDKANILISICGFTSVLLGFGFYLSENAINWIFSIIQISIWFYFLKYLILWVTDLHPKNYFRNNWFGLLLVSLITVGQMSNWIFGNNSLAPLPYLQQNSEFTTYYIIGLQIYFLVMVLNEIGQLAPWIGKIPIGPSGLMAISFIFLILSGSLLLMMPRMTYAGGLRFTEALFTSTSACCVTGLSVLDIPKVFTTRGQSMIMLLIQLGGLNVLSFATFFATFYRQTEGLRFQVVLRDIVTAGKTADTKSILRRIILYSITIELIGAILLFYLWTPWLDGQPIKHQWFTSLFHAVSAFNNAGFSIFSNNLADKMILGSYGAQFVIAILIILGGLGFIVLQDLFSFQAIKDRIEHPWRKYKPLTKVVLITSSLLILVGILVYLITTPKEPSNSYSGWLMDAFFQSVSTRTAGFNTVNIGLLSSTTLFFFIILMFIGASPGSTGGGIKTTTFAILIRSTIATLRQEKYAHMLKYNISQDLIAKASTVTLFALTTILISTFFLTLFEPDAEFLYLLFEEVSAFATVGLSANLTSSLSDPSLYVLIISMYIGRVGTLTVGLAIASKALYRQQKYPNLDIPVG